MIFVLSIIVLLSSCGMEQMNDESSTDIPADSDHTNVGRVADAEFKETEVVKEKLKSAIYGSHGWSIWSSNPAYIYAEFGTYMLRYNVSDNVIDRAVILKNEETAKEFIWHLAPDGRNAIIANIREGNMYYNPPRDIQLLDFENSKVTFLAHSGEELKIESLPDNLRSEFDVEKLKWKRNNGNLDLLNYTLASEYDTSVGSALFAKDTNLEKHEIATLRNSLINNEIPCVGIDGETIGSLIPMNADVSKLGYYKFVLIDITSDKIIQECPINSL